VLLGACALWVSVTSPIPADEPAKAPTARLAETIDGVAKGCKLFMGASRIPLERRAEPVLRWPNATRDTPDGATFLWTLDGRPAAMACVWQYGASQYGIAFHSLAADPLIAERDGAIIWHPDEAGIAFRSFPSAPPPADTPAKRLIQMRGLSRRFKCRLVGEGRSAEQLRILPQPIYRYQVDRENIVDGALFAFVQGTDPEAVVTLEAVRQDGKLAWRYALTRRTVVALEVDVDGEHVWSVPASAGGPGAMWFQSGITPAP
jgi:hypothetical protein